MKAERKDRHGNVLRALRALGYSITAKDVETILNVAEFVKEKGSQTTIGDLVELQQCTDGLIEEDTR